MQESSLHRREEETSRLSGRRRWADLGKQHWNIYITVCKTDNQREFDIRHGAPKSGRMGWGGRWERRLTMKGTHASVQFSPVAQSCPTLCDPLNRSTPGLPVHHQLPEFTQTHVHRVGDAIQPSHPLSSPSPPAPNPSQHQGLFQWVSSSHEVYTYGLFIMMYNKNHHNIVKQLSSS